MKSTMMMSKSYHQASRMTCFYIAILAVALTGCESTQEYKKFSEAGQDYAAAVDNLLSKASEIRLNSSSEVLLAAPSRTRARYQKISSRDEETLRLYGDLRLHNQLLSQYFSRLEVLANSEGDKSAQASNEAQNIANNLTTVGQKLISTPLIGNSEALRAIVGNITQFVVSSQITGALREELQRRGATIERELVIQKEVLKFLKSDLESDIKELQAFRENRLVIEPYTQTEPPNPEEWMKIRHEILLMTNTVQQINAAIDSLGNFQSIFRGFIEGKVGLFHIGIFVKDVENLSALVEALK